MKRILISLVALVVIAGLYVSTLVRAPTPPNHQVFIGGEVLTMDADNRIAEAVSVRDGIIEQVGTTDEISTLIKDSTAVVDLAGRTLIPVFWTRTATFLALVKPHLRSILIALRLVTPSLSLSYSKSYERSVKSDPTVG